MARRELHLGLCEGMDGGIEGSCGRAVLQLCLAGSPGGLAVVGVCRGVMRAAVCERGAVGVCGGRRVQVVVGLLAFGLGLG